MLGTIAGFWISLFIAVFVGIAVIGALVASGSGSKPEIGKNSILYLDLSSNIPERYQPSDIWHMLQNVEEDGDALVDILDAVRLAKNDSKINGIYINAAGAGAGMATREEIVNALRDFKSSGKWIYAYSDGYSQGDYVMSAYADSVFVNPLGGVDVHGVATSIPFFKDLMDKIGVKMQIVRVGTFKSAVEPFMGTEMSSASRLQNQVMVDSIWNYMTSVVSDARGVSAASVNQWADSMLSLRWGRGALEAKAVSALRYRREVEAMLREKNEIGEDDDLPLVTPKEYMSVQKAFSADKDHVAVLFACGDIVDSGNGGIVGDKMVPEIISLADNDKVKAMVLRVNSGGGSAFASEQIWEALEYFKSKDKPLYVSMGDYAASGGYYISCGADKIFADHTTLTGSIGVFGMIPDFSGLVTDKLGVRFSTVETNPNAAFPDVMKPLSEGQTAMLQGSVNRTYDLFTSRVAKGRGLSQDSVKSIAEGRVWTGGAALRLGLVDQIGGLNVAIDELASKVDLDTDNVVCYPSVDDKFLSRFLTEARKNVTIGSMEMSAGAMRILAFLDGLRTMNPVQARMMPMVVE